MSQDNAELHLHPGDVVDAVPPTAGSSGTDEVAAAGGGARGSVPRPILRDDAQAILDDFFRLSIELMCIADFDGYFRRVNPGFERVLGWSEAELLSRPRMDFVHPDDRAATIGRSEEVQSGRASAAFENRYLCRDGSYRWLSWNAIADPVKGLIYATAQDITARHEQQEATRMTEQFMTTLVENIPHMIFVKDAQNLRFVRLNKAGEELLGLPREAMIGKSDRDFFPPEEVEFFVGKDRAVLDAREIVDILEEPIQTKLGPRILHTKKIPILDGNGVPQYLLGISEDITERKKTEVDLYRAITAAEAASRAKSEFLATMSHELRTPLNAIIGFSEVLEDKTFGDLNTRQARYVNNILTSGRHLLQLINDILDIAKIEAGRLTLDREVFPAGVALRDVGAVVKALVNKKNIEFSLDVAPNLPRINADQPKFKQIMYNLVSNAIKFTHPGGRVAVVARACGEDMAPVPVAGANPGLAVAGVLISVSDTGIGIKPEDQSRVFREFEQVDSSYSRQQQGTGLGLTLTKNLVDLHGGRIWVESQGVEGQGSVFTFFLPIDEPAPSDAANPIPASSSLERPEALPPGAMAAPTAGRPLVMVVEDDIPSGDLIEDYLTEAGYEVFRVIDGEFVVDWVRQRRPAAVTLDLMLPHKDGWEVLSELKKNPETRDVPVIIVSMTDDRQLGFSLGAVDFLVKPAEKTRLLAALDKAVVRHDPARPISVLAVDDEPATLEYLRDLLEHHGFQVRTAGGGREAIELATQNVPDVLVLDLMMPDVTGFDVVFTLRAVAATREIPIIVFTAHDLSAKERQLLNHQIRALVSKTGKEDLLAELDKIRRLLPTT